MPDGTTTRVLHAASEIYPLVKTGGLGDVVASLPGALAELGVDARVLVPGYPAVMEASRGLEAVWEGAALFGEGPARILRGRLEGVGVDAYVLASEGCFGRSGGPYVGPDGEDWEDNHLRFAALSWAAAALGRGVDPDFAPEIVHGHDWQTGLAPAYLAHDGPARPRTVHTIHNIAYQGIFAAEVFGELGLPAEAWGVAGVEYYGRVGFLKAALWYADQLTTVSHTYAHEIQTPAHGHGLDGLLSSRADALTGIVNGVDYDVWDPRSDPALPAPFDAHDPHGKARCKAALRDRFGLAGARGPTFGVVSRLTDQKGLDLLLDASPVLLEGDGQFVVLGAGDPDLEERLRALAAAHPLRVGLHVGYDEELAHLIQAGSDVTCLPSRTEPCGLTQLYALRYGSLPLVRRTGGLADTVVDTNANTLADGSATGFLFERPTASELGDAMERALDLWERPELWRRVQLRAMTRDFSWSSSARDYASIYERLLTSPR